MLSLRERIAAYDAATKSASAPPSVSVSPTPVSVVLPTVDDEQAGEPFHDSPESCGSSVSGDPSTPASLDDPVEVPTPLVPAQAPCRVNEHLAVLIPRDLWKPDSRASRCDKFACRVAFSIFERKHHCRKCGGIFCQACSSHTTPLLDTSRLPFLLPPRNIPISQFASPNAPIVDARVCDDCYQQVHGYPALRPPPSDPKPMTASPLAHSSSSLSTLPPATPPDGRPLLPRSHSTGILSFNSPSKTRILHPPVVKTTKLEGDLDRYPLKDPSATCKAAGGGRWQPKRYPARWDARLPDGRLRYDVEAERMEEAERRRLANPVIVDGEIRVRKPRPPPPPPRGGPYKLPTF